jgi:hypothetical protein
MVGESNLIRHRLINNAWNGKAMLRQESIGADFAAEDASEFDGMDDQRARMLLDDAPLPLLNRIEVVGLLAIHKYCDASEIVCVSAQEVIDGLV